MYISLMFLTYMAASFVALLGLGLLLLLISKSRNADPRQYRMVMSFAIAVFALCLLYFVFYFRDMVLGKYEVNTVLRVLDYFFYGAIFFFWLRTIDAISTDRLKRIKPLSWIMGISIGMVGILGTILLMDEHYSISNVKAAGTYTVIEAVLVAFTAIIVAKYTFGYIRYSISKGKKIYVGIVSVTLLIWDIQTVFVDSSLYFGEYFSAWVSGEMDITGLAMTIVSLANFIYLFREDFSPQFYVKTVPAYEAVSLDPIELAAMQHHLTVREEEVLRLAYEGKNNPEIAEQLFISINTVKKHMKNIYEKLGVSTRMEMVFIINKGKTPDISE